MRRTLTVEGTAMEKEKAKAIRKRVSELHATRPTACDCGMSRDEHQPYHDVTCIVRTWFAECCRRAAAEAMAA
jgi:hypothetical protein